MPRAYRHFFLNDCKKAGTVATVFVPPADFEHVVASVAAVLQSKEAAAGSQRALNVSLCQLRSPFTCNVYFFCLHWQ